MNIGTRSFYSHIVLVALLSALFACGGGSSSSGGGEQAGGGDAGFDYGAMFVNLADNVIIPNYSAFKTAAEDNASDASAIAQYCAAIDTADEAASLSAAKTTWRNLMGLWQHAELHNLGPAASLNNLLRNQIYSFGNNPFSACGTDRAVIAYENDTENFDVSLRDFGSRGLHALEYLLFEESLNQTCPENIVTAVPQVAEWDSRPVEERKQARCNYASLLAEDISSAASEIENAWLADGDNYRSAFVNDSEQSVELVLNALSDALFYIEKDTKDAKLGVPLGLKDDDECTTVACPEKVESPYSVHSLENIKANLQSFLAIYTGDTGLSFDDIIAAADGSETNTGFVTDANAAIALVDVMLNSNASLMAESQGIIDDDLMTACQNSNANPATIQTVRGCALHGYLKRITDRLRIDFVTLVGVDLPDRVQSDAD